MSKSTEILKEKAIKTIFKADFNFEESRRKIEEFSGKYPVIGEHILALKNELTSEVADLFENPDKCAYYFIGEILDVNSEFIFPIKKNREFRDPIGIIIGSEEGSTEDFFKVVSESSRIDKIGLDLQPDLSFICKTEYANELLKTLVEQVEIELEEVEKNKAPIEAELNVSLKEKIEKALKEVHYREKDNLKEKMIKDGNKEIGAKVRENPGL